MTKEERELLLTTARVLRAKIAGEVYAEQRADWADMNDALKPFDSNVVSLHPGDSDDRRTSD